MRGARGAAALLSVLLVGCAYDLVGIDAPAADAGAPDAGAPDGGGCGGCIDFPLSTCTPGGLSVLVFQDPGACRDGRCAYAPREVACTAGCADGSCLDCTPACDGRTCGSDGCGGRCGPACDDPPAPSCVSDTTRRSWATVGQCSDGRCTYVSTDTPCPAGCEAGTCRDCTASCADRLCGDDGCGGSCGTCQAPPAGHCLDATTQRSYAALGTCADGRCGYTPVDTTCVRGCANGRCEGCTASCTGRECGGDGCGGLCGAGTCSAPPAATCANGILTSSPPTGTCSEDGRCSYAATHTTCAHGCANGACQGCTPSCGTRECGTDGCGGACGTGTCATPWPAECENEQTLVTYSATGTCLAGTCSYVPSGRTCAYGCANGACLDCTPETDEAFCARQDRFCGSETAADNCGTQRTVASCGTCPTGWSCFASRCICLPELEAAFCAAHAPGCGRVTAVDACGTTRTVACPACPPSLVTTGQWTILGVTTDDRVVLREASTRQVAVAPLSGGQPTVLLTPADGKTPSVLVQGRVVFAWSDASVVASQLALWSAATGVRAGPSASLVGTAAASPDGTRVAFTGGYVDGSPPGILVHAGTWQGTLPPVLFQSVPRSGLCPTLDYRGDTLFLSTCTGTGATAMHVEMHPPSDAPSTLRDQDLIEAVAWDGSSLLTVTSLLRVAGTRQQLEASVLGPAFFSDDSREALYVGLDRSLRWLDVAGGIATTTLVGSGVQAVHPAASATPGRADGWSGGGSVLYATNVDASGRRNLMLVNVGGPATTRTLVWTTTGDVSGDAFTTDRTRALYFTAVDPTLRVGTLTQTPVDGGPTTPLASGSSVVYATRGSQVVFNDGYRSVAGEALADIRTTDASTNAAMVLVQAGARPRFVLTVDRTRVVYALPTGAGGVYVTPVP